MRVHDAVRHCEEMHNSSAGATNGFHQDGIASEAPPELRCRASAGQEQHGLCLESIPQWHIDAALPGVPRQTTLRPFAAPHKAVKQYYLERKSKLLQTIADYEAFMILALTKHYLISFKVAERQYSCRTPRNIPM